MNDRNMITFDGKSCQEYRGMITPDAYSGRSS